MDSGQAAPQKSVQDHNIRHYRDLIAWQRSIDLVQSVYELTRSWPHDEIYGLTSQIRRAAVSVPANIAEGHGRISTKEYIHHLSSARGSLREVETHLIIAHRLRFIETEIARQIFALTVAVSRPLNGLIRELLAKISVPLQT